MAEKIQVILKEDVANLGRSGELVAVKPGYGRNYLIPQGLAIHATKKNIAQVAHEKTAIEARAAKTRKDAESVAARINGTAITLERQVGEGDKLFGSVTTRDIEEALAAKGHKVDRKQIQLTDALKTLGEHTVEIRVARDITAQIKVTIAPKAA